MMKKLLFGALLSCLFMLNFEVNAQTAAQRRKVERLFNSRKEVYFTFTINDRSEIHTLTDLISIDNVKENRIWAYARKDEFLHFITLGYKYKILKAPSLEHPVDRFGSDNGNRDLNLTAYPTYPEYVALMEGFASTYPDLCTLVNFGTTTQGRSLLALKITDNPNVREYEPQFLYTSTMHGDETTGYILMLDLIDWLLSNYGNDPEATSLINTMEIWINPLANPDGTYAAGDNTVNGATRENANGVDVNRNYPDPQDGPHPDGLGYQPETMAFMDFAGDKDFVMSANFHGGAEVFNYPWDTKPDDHPDRNWWMTTGANYVGDVHSVSGPSYFADFTTGFDDFGLTNGYAWYEVNGGRQDYMNTYRHCREVTIELSTTKLIPPSDFDAYWSYNQLALINYMKMCFQGFHGLVTDACTGNPLKAKVFVNAHDMDSSHVYTSMPVGNYYRPIASGTYSVTFSAPGYMSQTFNNVGVNDVTPLELNVALQPMTPTAAFTADAGNSCGSAVQFYDNSGSANQWLWAFGDDSTSTQQNPYHVYAESGVYNVQLSVSNCAGTDEVLMNAFINAQVITTPTLSDDSFYSCSPASFDLNATADGTIRWYDAMLGGNLISEGNSYSTPILTVPTTYYAESSVVSESADAGPLDNTIGSGGGYTGPTYHYIIFDAFADFDLVQVKVYADAAGTRTIDLRDASGAVLQSASITIPSGESFIDLNFHVTAGNGYQLGTAGQNGLYRNQAGAVFPYTTPGLVSLTGTSANNSVYYYYFYDWKIEKRCASPRVPLVIEVDNNEPLNALVSAVSTSFCEGENISLLATTNAIDPHFAWTLNGLAVGTDSPSYSNSALTGLNDISCLVTTSNFCGTSGEVNSNTLSVQISTQPATPELTFTTPNLLSSSATSGNQWYLDGVAIQGGNAQQFTATENGIYTVAVLNGDCSSALSNPQNVIDISVNALQKTAYSIYPNPAHEQFVVRGTATSGAEITVTNVLGQTMFKSNLTRSAVSIPCIDWPVGFYFAQIRAGSSTEVLRVEVK